MSKLQGVQIGRGIAALAVVIFHAKLILNRFPDDEYIRLPYFFSHGDIGVSFFFVISGFIISYVIDKETFNLPSFFIKRFFRLWPTYLVCTILFAVIYLIHRNKAAADLGYSFDYLLSSIFILPMQDRPVLQPGWSLEHEVLFYLFTSLVAAFFGLRGVVYGVLGVVATSIAARVILPEVSDFRFAWDYHILESLNICFLAGIGLYLYFKKYKNYPELPNTKYCLAIGAVLIIVAPYLVEFLKPFTYGLSNLSAITNMSSGFVRFTVESFASVILLYGLLGVRSRSMIARGLAAIGDRSYSLYLGHFIFIPIFNYTHRELISWPQQFAEILCALFVLLALFFAYLLHWCVEQPSSNYGVNLANRLSKVKA